MVGDKDLERTDICKESHLVHRLDHCIHNLIFEGLQHDCLILYLKGNIPITIMNATALKAFHGQDGDDVAVAACAGSLDLAVKLDSEDVVEVRAEELGLKSKCLSQIFLTRNTFIGAMVDLEVVQERTSCDLPWFYFFFF